MPASAPATSARSCSGGRSGVSAVATGDRRNPATRIEAQGDIALQRLATWLGLQQPLPASGELPYQLRLDLAGADSRLQLDSSLAGLAIELPAPFGKPVW